MDKTLMRALRIAKALFLCAAVARVSPPASALAAAQVMQQAILPFGNGATPSASITIINDWQMCDGANSCAPVQGGIYGANTPAYNAIPGDTIFTIGLYILGSTAQNTTDGCRLTDSPFGTPCVGGSAGNTYTCSQLVSGGSALWYCYVLHSAGYVDSLTGGTSPVQCNASGAYAICAAIILRGVTALDVAPSIASQSSTSFDSGAATTSALNEVLGGAIDCLNGRGCATSSANSPWTGGAYVYPSMATLQCDIYNVLCVSGRSAATVGAYHYTGTTSGNADYAGIWAWK